MRHNFATGQFILLYSIIVLIYKFIDCHDICTKPELRKYEKVIFQSNAYNYSHHYYYSRMIRSDQSPPIVSGTFERLVDNKDIYPKFSFTFYGSKVINFRILTTGRIEMYDENYLGVVRNYVRSGYYVKTDISNERELLAVRMSYYPVAGGKIPTFTITTLIHPNGKISIYYANIPTVARITEKPSGIYGWLHCGETDKKVTEIYVPKTWIRSGTLVVYEALGDCPKYDSTEACRGSKAPKTRCIWCETANMCITRSDKDIYKLKVNGCKNKYIDTDKTTSEDTEDGIPLEYFYPNYQILRRSALFLWSLVFGYNAA
ncbi:hypothetical protein MS3_00000699 [Schistosoma haematobium]|uniref:Egg protein CP391S-like protein n=1 Tax=Schistosoma haematobium TaxID=6185 RepID=A0A922IIV2_SCHHA|nr:hypothetical protein MS3_00000699 [Schistosoma haematobium]KAH9580540.1 hypothetical protein MS3_00000699 [Schistosoma haematobium]